MKLTSSLKIFHSLSLALFVWGCDSATQNVQLESVVLLQQQTQERLQKAERPIFVHWGNVTEDSQNFQFDCEDCPKSVGQLIVKSDVFEVQDGKQVHKIQSGNCQGGLIGEDLFLTNRHCLPVDIQSKGDSCSGRAKVIFSEQDDDTALETAECDKVVDLFPLVQGFNEKDAQPDWALLKLKTKFPHRKSNISTDGLANQKKLYAYVPLRSIESDFFNMEKITCVIHESSLLPLIENEKSPIQLAHCDKDITKGFSGTLLFDSESPDAKVAGVISHIWNEGVASDEVIISRNVIVSNMHCIAIEEGEPIPDHCKFNGDRVQKLKENFGKRVLQRAYHLSQEKFEKWIKDSSSPIEWEKVDLEKINNLQDTYKHFFEVNREFKDLPFGGANSDLLTAVTLPYVPKCVRSKESQTIQLPSIDFQIRGGRLGRPDIHIELILNRGRLHENNNDQFVLLVDETAARMQVIENTQLRGPYFVPSVYLSPCE